MPWLGSPLYIHLCDVAMLAPHKLISINGRQPHTILVRTLELKLSRITKSMCKSRRTVYGDV